MSLSDPPISVLFRLTRRMSLRDRLINFSEQKNFLKGDGHSVFSKEMGMATPKVKRDRMAMPVLEEMGIVSASTLEGLIINIIMFGKRNASHMFFSFLLKRRFCIIHLTNTGFA